MRCYLKAVLLAALIPVTVARAEDDLIVLSVNASYAGVVLDVEDAIVNRGYVVDHRGHVGTMLKRTQDEVGATGSVYKNAEYLQFCSVLLARKAFEKNPNNIAYCPYTVFVYETEANPGVVEVGYRKLPAGEERDAINTLLSQIVQEAAKP